MLDREALRSLTIVAVVAVLTAVLTVLWAASGDSDVTVEGDIALGIGVFLAVMLGGGLMTMVFLSNRSGRDQ